MILRTPSLSYTFSPGILDFTPCGFSGYQMPIHRDVTAFTLGCFLWIPAPYRSTGQALRRNDGLRYSFT